MLIGLFTSYFGAKVGGLLAKVLPYLLLITLVLILVIGIWISGYRSAMREHKVLTLETELMTKNDDLEIAKRAEADAESTATQFAAEKQVLSDQLKGLRDASTVGTCRLSADDAARLRGIGAPVPGDGGRKGLSSFFALPAFMGTPRPRPARSEQR